MTATWQRWVEAAKVLGNDPAALVPCPVCGQANLKVTDVFPYPEATVFERYLECPSCGSKNIMRKSAEPAGADEA